MKKTLLSIFVLASALASAQQFHATSGRAMHGMPNAGDRTATDTVGAGSLNYSNTMPTLYNSTGGGWVVGNNGYGEKAFVQEFELDNPASVVGIGAWFGAKKQTSGNPNSHLVAKLYHMNGTGQSSTDTTAMLHDAPNANSLYGSVNVPIANVDSSSMFNITYTDFANEIYVPTEFGAGYDLTALVAGDSVGVVSTDDGNFEFPDHSWERFSNWFSIKRGWNLNIDLFLFVVLDNNNVGIHDAGTFNGMRMSFREGNCLSGDATVDFTVDHAAHMRLMVFDPAGRNIVNNDLGTQSAGQHSAALNSASWGAGQYIVTITADGRPLAKKLFKD